MLRVCVLATVALILSATGSASTTDDYSFTSWSEKHGLTAGRIWSIAQDDEGYLWLGTSSGLVRFDGTQFERPRAIRGVALPSGGVAALLRTSDGTLLAGYLGEQGIVRLGGKQAASNRPFADAPRGVRFLFEDHERTVWAAASRGVFRLDGERWTRLESPPNAARLYEDGSGMLWAATSRGLYVKLADQDIFRPATSQPALLGRLHSIVSLGPTWQQPSEDGRVSTDTDLSFSPTTLGSDRSTYIAQDHQHNNWVSSAASGLWRIALGTGGKPDVQHFTTHEGLSSDLVSCLYVDDAGNLWVGTAAGLQKLSPRRIRHSATFGRVRAVTTGSDEALWIGTANGLFRLLNDTQRRFDLSDGLPSPDIYALSRDATGGVIVGTARGIARWTGQRFTALEIPRDGRVQRLSAFAAHRDGSIWMADTLHGLFRWQDGKLSRIDPLSRTNGPVSALFVDRDGQVWVGAAGALLSLYDRAGNLLGHPGLPGLNGEVTCIIQDSNGRIWVGTSDGVAYIAGERSVVIDSESSGLPPGIASIAEDGAGGIWLGTSGGLVNLDRSELDDFDPAHARRLGYRLFDEADGLDAMPITAMPASARKAPDQMWFVTGTGLASFSPSGMTTRETPRAHIKSVEVGSKLYEATPGLLLPAGSSAVHVNYAGISFLSPGKLKYRYRLEGLDADWTDAGSRREAIYTNLAPREYRFVVTATGNDGESGRVTTALTFAIEPWFHQTWWFFTLCCLAAALLVASFWWYRVRQLQSRFAEVLAERSRLAREIHDTLLQSMVAVILQLDAVAATSSESARGTFVSLRKELQARVREVRKSIANLRTPVPLQGDIVASLRTAAEELTQRFSVRLNFRVHGKARPCTADVHEQLLRIGQEAMLNALTHGHPTEIQVEMRFDADRLLLQIGDDGCGFDADVRPPGSADHFGLISMRERAANIGATFQLTSEPGRGTQIRVSMGA